MKTLHFSAAHKEIQTEDNESKFSSARMNFWNKLVAVTTLGLTEIRNQYCEKCCFIPCITEIFHIIVMHFCVVTA